MNLKNHNKLSLAGYVFGFAFAFLSAVRYFLIWPDMDKAVVYVIIGFLICSISFINSRLWNFSNTISYIEEQLEEKWKER